MKEKIKMFLRKNWFKVGLLTIILLFSVVFFYLYEWRPSQIRKECSIQALIKSGAWSHSQSPDYNFFYELCLKEYGLEK